MSDTRGPFRAQDPVGNLLHVRQQKIHRSHFSFAGGQIHLPGAADQVVDIRWSFFEQFDVSVGALFTYEFIRIGFAGQG